MLDNIDFFGVRPYAYSVVGASLLSTGGYLFIKINELAVKMFQNGIYSPDNILTGLAYLAGSTLIFFSIQFAIDLLISSNKLRHKTPGPYDKKV